MDFRKFSLFIVLRTLLIMLTLVALSLCISTTGYHAATLLAFVALVVQSLLLFRFVAKTNQELVRFLDAARHADYSQRFEFSSLGSGFEELGQAFTDILQRFQNTRNQQETEQKHLKAIVEHVPVPLISLNEQGVLHLWNNAARKLFGTNKVTQPIDLEPFSNDITNHLERIKPGERRLVTFNIDGMEHKLSLSATQIVLGNHREMLVSMQDIQTELDSAQLQAWQDLVKVLTHEIMNSITPVASLASTAADLVQDTQKNASTYPELVEELEDISDAVNTVSRRSHALIEFVSSYRRLTKLPAPNKQRLKLASIIEQVQTLSTQDWAAKGIKFEYQVTPSSIEVMADQTMLEQVLINLIKNAEHAVADTQSAKVTIKATINKRGHVAIDVSDNGPGIAEDISENIFVPFYTTKAEGSGVGLALTRQIMLAHGGSIKYSAAPTGGAVFSLVF